MFKKFTPAEDIAGSQQLKTSVQVRYPWREHSILASSLHRTGQAFQRSIRAKLIETYPHLEPILVDILPKKENFKQIKCRDHVELIADHEGTVRFIKPRDLPYVPTLRLLHQVELVCLGNCRTR